MSVYLLSSWNTYAATPYSLAEDINKNSEYLRIRRNGITYYFDFSRDGVSFINLYASTLAFTPQFFGVGTNAVNYNGGQPYPVSSIFSFFRYKNSNTGTVPIEGRLLNIRTL